MSEYSNDAVEHIFNIKGLKFLIKRSFSRPPGGENNSPSSRHKVVRSTSEDILKNRDFIAEKVIEMFRGERLGNEIRSRCRSVGLRVGTPQAISQGAFADLKS